MRKYSDRICSSCGQQQIVRDEDDLATEGARYSSGFECYTCGGLNHFGDWTDGVFVIGSPTIADLMREVRRLKSQLEEKQ